MSVLKNYRDVEQIAAECGIAAPKVIHGGRVHKHPKPTGTVNGRQIAIPVPCTPGDRRNSVQLRAQFRRMVRNETMFPGA